jgi:hypothetical protein
MKVGYTGLKLELFDLNQLTQIQHVSEFDKHEFFNSILFTNFNYLCHYGSLQVDLSAVDIPLDMEQLMLANTTAGRSTQQLYLIKMKEQSHQN